MKNLFFSILTLGLFLFIMPASAQNEEATKKAQELTKAWLPLIDDGQYAESWEAASPMFQQSVTQAQWEQAAKQYREPLGEVQSRELQKTEYTTSLPNAPEGEYVVVEYASSFAEKQQAIETAILSKTDAGEWGIVGYFIR